MRISFLFRCRNGVPAKQLIGSGCIYPLLGRNLMQQNNPQRRNGWYSYPFHSQVKGLEFHTVLIPFCDWKLENETNNQLIWCSPSESPFSALDIVPVNYSSTMAESVYRQEYLNERLQLWVDNLNLLYVAFTRAGKNLILWSKKGQKGTMSELIANALPHVAARKVMKTGTRKNLTKAEYSAHRKIASRRRPPKPQSTALLKSLTSSRYTWRA